MRLLSPIHQAVLPAAAAFSLAAGPARAATLIYETVLKLDGSQVGGGVTGGPSGTNNTIALTSFAVSFARTYTPTGTTGGTLGNLDFSPVVLGGTVGSQSAALVADRASGMPFKSVKIDFYKSYSGDPSAAKPEASWLFTNPHVTDYAQTAPDEAYQFDGYTKVQYTYMTYAADGSTLKGTYTAGWNRVKNISGVPSFVAETPTISGDVSGLSFVTSASVPEPAAAAGVVLAGVLLGRRKRRPSAR